VVQEQHVGRRRQLAGCAGEAGIRDYRRVVDALPDIET
jgi:hypothetical protein